jgi:hypothetical protein
VNFKYILTHEFRIAQNVHHTILKTRYDIQSDTVVENDHNFLWKNIDDDFDDSILQTRRRLNDIKNEEKQSRNLIEQNRVKKIKQMIAKNRKNLLMSQFHVVQNLWRSVIKFLAQKIKYLNLCDLQCWACVSLFFIYVNERFIIIFIIIHTFLQHTCSQCFTFYDNLYDNFLTNVF